jgi:outer membrane protein insertion porin family
LLALLLLSYPRTRRDLIVSITVHGNRRIPPTLSSPAFSLHWRCLRPGGSERDFNSLWNASYFKDIRFGREQTPKDGSLHIYVKERPTIPRDQLAGLGSVSTSDVLSRSRSVGWTFGGSRYDPPRSKSEVTLKELLAGPAAGLRLSGRFAIPRRGQSHS